jgi:predicted nuclease of predicted toxin-antitoxin system
MSITLVLDQGVPRDAAGRLRDLGYECIHVGEVGMSAAGDCQILEFALLKNAVVVTLDADFHAILAVSRAAGPSVIRIRVQGLTRYGNRRMRSPSAFASETNCRLARW